MSKIFSMDSSELNHLFCIETIDIHSSPLFYQDYDTYIV